MLIGRNDPERVEVDSQTDFDNAGVRYLVGRYLLQGDGKRLVLVALELRAECHSQRAACSVKAPGAAGDGQRGRLRCPGLAVMTPWTVILPLGRNAVATQLSRVVSNAEFDGWPSGAARVKVQVPES